MINYRKILELHDQGISLRGIAASTGNSRQKVTKAIELAKEKGLVCPLDEEMTDKWIEDFLFPERSLEGSGRQLLNFDHIPTEVFHATIVSMQLSIRQPYESVENQVRSWKLIGLVLQHLSLTVILVKKSKHIFL